jgi:hypothetical protein
MRNVAGTSWAFTSSPLKPARTTWAQRTIRAQTLGATVNRISTTNADGCRLLALLRSPIAGNVNGIVKGNGRHFQAPSLYTGQSSITTLGTIATGDGIGTVDISVIGSLYGGLDASGCSGVLLFTAGTAVCTGTSGTGTLARTISPTSPAR